MPHSRIHNIIEHGTQPNTTTSNIKQSQELLAEIAKYRHGEILALNVIVEKIRTFNEIVALQALNMLEYIAEHSTPLLQQEIGRNRFLNELAKMLSPKYDAGKCPESVKIRISEIFHDWAKMFPTQPKISLAYNTLFNKGYIIKNNLKNKKIKEDNPLVDSYASKKLDRLLKSNHPDDLLLANRLIKNMVQKEENRTHNIHDRKEKITLIEEKVQLLRDMMKNHNDGTTKVEIDVIREIKNVCQVFHTELNEIANKAILEKDPYLNDLMKLSDNLTNVLNEYQIFEQNYSKNDLNEIFSNPQPLQKLELADHELKKANIPSNNDDDFLDLFLNKSNSNTNLTLSNNDNLPNISNNDVLFQNLTNTQPSSSNKNYTNGLLNNKTPSNTLEHSLDNYFSNEIFSNLPVKNSSINISSMNDFNVDMNQIEILKTVQLSGSKLMICLAYTKLKSNFDNLSNNTPNVFVFTGMNMTNSLINNIELELDQVYYYLK